MRQHALAAKLLILFLTGMPVSASGPLMPPALAPLPSPARAPRRPAEAPVRRAECGRMAVDAVLAKARAELRDLGMRPDPAAIARRMESDPEFARRVAETFANSDLIVSRYGRRGGCEVTVRLPLDKLRRLARP